MVQIPQYEQQIGLNAPSRDIPNVVSVDDGGIGQALQGLGSAVSQVAEAARARKQRIDTFNTKVAWDTWGERQAQKLTELEQSHPGDGQGLHDEFMKWRSEEGPKVLETITDPELRAQHQTLFSTYDNEHWGNLAANAEHKRLTGYQFDQLTTAGEKAKLGIAQNPGSYKAYVQSQIDLINASQLDPENKRKLIDDIRETGPKFLAAGLQQSDPETYKYLMGLGSHQERIGYLQRRVIAAESSWDPRAESGKGASGIMQVMPDSAGVDVARRIGDKAYLAMTTEQRKEFLKDPRNGYAYGSTYLSMKVEEFDGDVELALIAYNAGADRAKEFVAAGRDWSKVKGKWALETQPYVAKVMDGMGAAQFVSGSVANSDGDAPTVGGKRIPLMTGTQAGRQPLQMAGVSKEVIGTWEQVQGSFGRALPVVSGFRDAATNRKAGGANKSQHIGGNALDIDVSGLSKEERIRLVKIASAHGFTGIGIYTNSIHLDMRGGAPVAWGKTHHAASVPAWAFHVAAQHRAGAYRQGGPVQIADAGTTMSDAGPGYVADGVPGGVPRSGFVAPMFEGMSAGEYLKMQSDAADGYTKAQAAQIAQDTTDQILATAGANDAGPGDREAAYQALNAIKDADLKKDVAPLIESHFNRWEKVQQEQAKQTLASTWDLVEKALDKGETNAAFVIAKKADVPQADRDKMLDRIAKGPVRDDDQRLVQSLDAMRFANPKQFMEIDFRKVGDLTNPTLKGYMELQQKMVEDAQKATAEQIKASEGLMKDKAAEQVSMVARVNETFSKASPIVDRYFLETGIPTKADKMTPSDAEHANFVRSQVAKELETRQMASKVPLTITEIQDTVDAVMKTYPRYGTDQTTYGWYDPRGWAQPDKDVNLNEVLTAYGEAGLDPDAMAAAIRKKGMQVNAQTMQQMLDTFNASKAAQ